ncbi:MAG: hypothetical protein KatS3mg113_0183 [Planctomycetaceae bacterium]|nr:MAG: hypothetical protein KatS3mg113_0183 [Planctomycetaceae bacterium]
MTPQQERVSVQTTWQARLQGHRLLVQQRLIHRVEYGRVSDFVIMVPEPWSSRMRFFHQGRELQPEWGPGTAAGQVSAWLNVTPVAGEDVVFEVVWSQMLPSSWTGLEPISLKLPILRSGLTPTEDCLAEVESGGWYRGQLQGEGWTLVYEDEERRRWRHAHPALECTLTLSAAEHQPSPRLQIPRAFLRVEWDRSCAQTYWFQASVKSSWSQLLVQLPPESTLEQVWWDDQELTAPHWEAQPVGSSRYVLHVPVNQSESNHLLSLRYHVRGQGRFSGITSLQAVPPELPQAEWSGEVIWELRLPGDQHVWTPPQAAPLYRWKRVGWLWQREPWPEGFDHAAWVKGALTGPVTPPPLAPHHYAYRQLGRAEPLFLRSLSTSLALLCGGSFSLIVGFFSLRGTWMRSLLVVLGALCGLVVVSLWYLAELELLLQPMVWGAVFPLLIGLIESWQRRRRWSAHLLGPRPRFRGLSRTNLRLGCHTSRSATRDGRIGYGVKVSCSRRRPHHCAHPSGGFVAMKTRRRVVRSGLLMPLTPGTELTTALVSGHTIGASTYGYRVLLWLMFLLYPQISSGDSENHPPPPVFEIHRLKRIDLPASRPDLWPHPRPRIAVPRADFERLLNLARQSQHRQPPAILERLQLDAHAHNAHTLSGALSRFHSPSSEPTLLVRFGSLVFAYLPSKLGRTTGSGGYGCPRHLSNLG